MSRPQASFVVGALLCATALFGGQFRLPPQRQPDLFGNVLIRRATRGGAAKPVTFSHASHRVRYTCRVCHLELDFAFRANATEITEEANRRGSYCGACHDGKIAFGHSDKNCGTCHTGESVPAKLSGLPPSEFGNRVDWSKALQAGDIHPATTLFDDGATMTLDTTLTLEAEWSMVPPAIFPHAEHVRWLDCANCHPSIFNIKKKATKHFSMELNLNGEFCGVCHLRVAFPMNDCQRCHPAIKGFP